MTATSPLHRPPDDLPEPDAGHLPVEPDQGAVPPAVPTEEGDHGELPVPI